MATGSGEFEISCTGWWEQAGFGRQPMDPLDLVLQDGRMRGAGQDIIGTFDLAGTLDDTGRVAMVKQYRNRHQVLYAGTYDGEGTMSGLWDVGIDRGRWLIHFAKSGNASSSEIQEILPG